MPVVSILVLQEEKDELESILVQLWELTKQICDFLNNRSFLFQSNISSYRHIKPIHLLLRASLLKSG